MDNEFYKIVNDYKEKRDGKFIFNASIDHAKIIFEKLFECAKEDNEEVRIVSGNLGKEFNVTR